MKQFFTLAGLAATALLTVSCASEGPTADELGEQFRRGARGEGRVTADIDRTNDPYVKPREGGMNPSGD